MPQNNSKTKFESESEDRYQGFSLKSVCWGYQEIFKQAIEKLFEEGSLGPERQEVTGKFFDLLKSADQSCFDWVLKDFLGALNPSTRWIMDLPGIFADVVDLGRTLAESKCYYGARFFEILGSGGFGDSPEQVRNLLTMMRRLRQIDEELAVAFMKGYSKLKERLELQEMELYVKVGLEIFNRNRKSGLAFMEGVLKTSETYICSITQECRLCDVQNPLTSMLKALTGYEVEVCDITRLDSDELIERGTSVVCMYKWLYLPARIRIFDNAAKNRNWYMLAAIVAAGMLTENSFCRVHGHPDYQTCRNIVGDDRLRLNLFQITEYLRVLQRVRKNWPGARRLIDFGLSTEFEQYPAVTGPDRLFHDAISGQASDDYSAGKVVEIADGSINLFDTARQLDKDWVAAVLRDYPDLDRGLLRTFSFLPDFLFPGSVSSPPKNNLAGKLKAQSNQKQESTEENNSNNASAHISSGNNEDASGEEDENNEGKAACFIYDEWSNEENDYYRDYCFVHEDVPKPVGEKIIPPDITDEARRVSRVFERLKPDLARREKYLSEGDVINPDLLLEYLVLRRKEPSPRINFYEKPLVNQRDLAVLILLDVSGSTGEMIDHGKKVLDVEKHAALILGQGLDSLGDRFSVCGFSSNGRENCIYFIYKNFDEPWNKESMSKILSAYPISSTRVGPALRHSGYRLNQICAKQRLIILVTDGKPMDNLYDFNTRYAQHDVRMACVENMRQGMHTFGISTEENSLADMEIMFPQRRFVILPDIRQLPQLLPKLYVRLTA